MLLATPGLSAWDVVSTSELKRLPLSVARAMEAARSFIELKNAKALLLKSERSITIGRLLGSIAHEINNPLEAISNLLYLAQMTPRISQDSISNYLKMAEKELQHVSEITKQTLAFHRDSKMAQEVRVTEALDSVLVLYRTKLEVQQIEVKRQYRSTGVLLGYLGELRQVFANLIANAIDAMPSGGKLTLRVREQDGLKSQTLVTIADTGSGMSRDVSMRLGELFYTTKGESGTGLGMWVAQQIVRKYGGSLRAFSSMKTGTSGTVFRLSFSLTPR